MAEVKNNGSIELKQKKNYRKNSVNFQSELPADKIKASLIYACERDGGKYVSFGVNADGILIAGVCINKQYYFAMLNKDRNVEYFDASDKYSLLKEIPSNLSVLSYVWDHDRQYLKERAFNALAVHEDGLLTDIYIKVPVINKNKNTNNKYKKSKK